MANHKCMYMLLRVTVHVYIGQETNAGGWNIDVFYKKYLSYVEVPLINPGKILNIFHSLFTCTTCRVLTLIFNRIFQDPYILNFQQQFKV